MAAPAVAAAAKAVARRALVGAATSSGARRAGCGCAAIAALALAVGCIAILAGFAVIASPLGADSGAAEPQPLSPGSDPMDCPGLRPSQGYGDTPYEHPHTGIDLLCPADTPVVSIASGLLRQRQGAPLVCAFPAGSVGGLGTYAEVDSGDVAYLYGHLDRFAVADGTPVVPGTIIGYEGTSGCSTGFHLHFEVRVAGRASNPCPFLPQGYPSAHDAAGNRCWGSAPP